VELSLALALALVLALPFAGSPIPLDTENPGERSPEYTMTERGPEQEQSPY
jgi:hypothetical protein